MKCPLCKVVCEPDPDPNKSDLEGFWKHCEKEHKWDGIDRNLICGKRLPDSREICQERFPSELDRAIHIAGEWAHDPERPLILRPTHLPKPARHSRPSQNKSRDGSRPSKTPISRLPTSQTDLPLSDAPPVVRLPFNDDLLPKPRPSCKGCGWVASTGMQRPYEHIVASLPHRNGQSSCPLCGELFKNDTEGEDGFWKHQETKHPWDGVDHKLRCRVDGCQRTFPTDLLREIHILRAPEHQIRCPIPSAAYLEQFQHCRPSQDYHPVTHHQQSYQDQDIGRNGQPRVGTAPNEHIHFHNGPRGLLTVPAEKPNTSPDHYSNTAMQLPQHHKQTNRDGDVGGNIGERSPKRKR